MVDQELAQKSVEAGYDGFYSLGKLHHWIINERKYYVNIDYDFFTKVWVFQISNLSSHYSSDKRTIIPKDCLKHYDNYEDALIMGLKKTLDVIILQDKIGKKWS